MANKRFWEMHLLKERVEIYVVDFKVKWEY